LSPRFLPAVVLAASLALADSAAAAILFRQTFEGPLGANETLGGRFVVADGKVGHADHYRNNEYSYYQLALDLTQVTAATLRFDYEILSEVDFDGFNVLGSTSTAFSAADDLLTPAESAFYGRMSSNFLRLGRTAASGDLEGTATFDLTRFAGQTVNLRFQFQSDSFAFKPGVRLDNLLVTGSPIVSPAPEPTTWAVLILGFFALGATMRRQKAARRVPA
jgi:hypothetical protein